MSGKQSARPKGSIWIVHSVIELCAFLLILIFFFIWTLSLQRVIKTTYVKMQSAEINRVEALIDSYSLAALAAFEKFAASPSPSRVEDFLSDFSEVYEVTPQMHIGRIYKIPGGSRLVANASITDSALGLFLKTLPSGAQVIAPFTRSDKSGAVGVYVCFAGEDGCLVGRVRTDSLRSALDSLAEFSGSLVALCSESGDILFSSYEPLPFAKITEDMKPEVVLFGGNYLMSRKPGPILQSQIVLFTPLTIVDDILKELNAYVPFAAVFIVLFFLLKIVIQSRFTVLPLTRFSELVAAWDIDGIDPRDSRTSQIVKYREIETLFGTFARKTRQMAEAFDRLRSLRLFLQNIIDSMPSGLVVTDRNGIITLCNSAARSLADSAMQDPTGKPLKDVFPSLNAYAGRVDLALRSGREIAFPVEPHQKKPGRYVKTTLFPLVHGEIGGLVFRTDDVTELELVEQQLRQSQKMEAIGMLAGGIAHDFNNLLTVIRGYADLLDKGLQTAHPLKTNIEQIMRAAQRASDLTAQMLAFSRKQVLQLQVVSLNDVVRSMEEMLPRIIGEDLELEILLQPEIARCKVDPGQIEQVIMNLAANARDAMPRGGKLTIETADRRADEAFAREHPGIGPGAYVMLSVRDTGTGMDKETLSRIFDPFFTTKEIGKGTGLGLATVYGIVKQSGGHVFCFSEKGSGTLFELLFPRVSAEGGREPAAAKEPGSVKGTETVLLVEDEDSLRRLIRTILQINGYDVIETRNGVEALAAVGPRRCGVDLLLTDVVMPHMSGRELGQKMNEICPEVKILYMSGYTDDAVVRHGILNSEVNLIQKPFESKSLLTRVREVLDRKS